MSDTITRSTNLRDTNSEDTNIRDIGSRGTSFKDIDSGGIHSCDVNSTEMNVEALFATDADSGTVYPVKRKLCGLYFHICRDGEWGPVCFTDMTEAEQEKAIRNKDTEWLWSMISKLAGTIRRLGDQFDIVSGRVDDVIEEGEENEDHTDNGCENRETEGADA